jgi:ribonuclease P protein component
MNAVRHTLGKEYKLRNKRIINELFDSGHSKKHFPFVIYYKPTILPTKERFQVVFSAPKRRFKHAVERNRIKRILRELFRKNKLILEQHLMTSNQQLAVFLIYNGASSVDSKELETRFIHLLKQLRYDISQAAPSKN